MTELAEKLPWREELELFQHRLKRAELKLFGRHFPGVDTKDYAGQLITRGDLPKKALENPEKVRPDLILGLERAALYHWFGLSVGKGIKHNATMRRESRALRLKLPPKHRPKRYEDDGFIWVMAITWEHFGGTAGTATYTVLHKKAGAETPSPFKRFCTGWLKQIDPDRSPPGRKVYRRVLERAEGEGVITIRRRST